MKRIAVHPIQDLKKVNGLLFFTECLEELLFVHANDSFKAPALNTYTRTLELERLIYQAQATKKTRALHSVLEELRWSVERDPVIQKSEKR